MADKVRVHIFISGRVQGVFFRQQTKNKARALGITGWIRNLPDGRVEAVFEGKERDVEELVGWAEKGPILAKVNGFKVERAEYKGEFNDFETRYG